MSHLKACDPAKFNLNFPRYGLWTRLKGPHNSMVTDLGHNEKWPSVREKLSTKLEPFCGVQCRNRKWNSEESATCRNIWGIKRGLVSMINVNNLICGTNCTTSCVPAQRHYSQKHHGSKYPQGINKQSTKWSSSGFFVGTWRNGLITGSPSLCTNNVQN